MAVAGIVRAARADDGFVAVLGVLVIVACILGLAGLFTVAPNQGQVLQLFGAYRGTAREEGLRWANPFFTKKRVSLRVRNFESAHLKVNDTDGNPIEIAAIVVWRVVDTAEAVFEVDDYEHYVKVQTESAVRNLATHYPYDAHIEGHAVAARQHGRGGEEAQERDPGPAREGRGRGDRGAHQPPGLRAGDRGGHAAAPAGGRHHRGPAEDRRGRGGHGGDGAGAARRRATRCTSTRSARRRW